jgi:glycosyltransferase involved in cell wall biosynthesis
VLVHCHGLVTLAAGVRVSRSCGAPLLYDVHELETEANGLGGLRQRVYKAAERRLIRRADAVLAVSDSIADWYAREYGIERPTVVRNVPVRPEGPPPGRSQILRATAGIPEGELIFLYAGGLFQGRRVEQFLRVFSRVSEDRHVVFMGYGELEGMVRSAAVMRRNIHFLPAVPATEVVRHAAGADVGLMGVENVCLSYYYSLPNKLFECLLAGVPVVAGDWPEIRRVIEADGCGWVVGETDEDWRRFVSGVSGEEIQRRREGALRARMRYSWQNEEATLVGVYRRLLGRSTERLGRVAKNGRRERG